MESNEIRLAVTRVENVLREILAESRKQTAILEKIAEAAERAKQKALFGSEF